MKTFNHSTIQRHIIEGGRYDENGDGSVTLYSEGSLVLQRVRDSNCPHCGAPMPYRTVNRTPWDKYMFNHDRELKRGEQFWECCGYINRDVKA